MIPNNVLLAIQLTVKGNSKYTIKKSINNKVKPQDNGNQRNKQRNAKTAN